MDEPERALLARVAEVEPADAACASAARARWQRLAKPLGGLGVLEDDVCRIAAVQRRPIPALARRALAVFCADNGVVAEGVSQTGQDVTRIVAENMCTGRTSVCAMARLVDCAVVPVDMGISRAVRHPSMRDLHVARGTRDFLHEDAMTRTECARAVLNGFILAQELAAGHDILLTGEMGIGNTTTSSAVLAVLLGRDPADVTGHGAGLSADGVRHKTAVIRAGIAARAPRADDVLDVLSKVGGLDIAGMAGFFVGGAAAHRPVVVDGFISAVAALCAVRLCPAAAGALIASHVGSEPASQVALDALGLSPAISAGLHLGEGTGAVALLPLLDMALQVFTTLPTFGDINVETYQPL